MNIPEFLNELKEANISLTLAGAKLKVSFPKSGADPVLIGKIKTHKEELIQFFSSIRKKDSNLKIESIPIADYYPTTSSQKGIWILDRFDKVFPTYNMVLNYELKGAFSVDLCKKAFSLLIKKHETLRTTFVMIDQELKQKVHEHFEVDLEYFDISNAQNTKAEAERILNSFTTYSFTLDSLPLFKIIIVKSGEEHYFFEFLMHHTIGDGGSYAILMQEFTKIYNELQKNREPVIDSPKFQYKDFAHWQENLLQKELQKGNHRKYWHKMYATLPDPLNLRGAKTRPPVQSHEGGRGEYLISKEVFDALDSFSKEYNVSIFTILYTAVALLLCRESEQDTFVLGTVALGRTIPEVERMVGCFVNTLPIKIEIDSNGSVMDLLYKMRTDIFEAYQHQDYPIDVLIQELDIPRDNSRPTLVDVLINYVHKESANLALDNIESTEIFPEYPISKIDLTFDFMKIDENIHFLPEYSTDLFDAVYIDFLYLNLLEIIKSICEKPDRTVDRLLSNAYFISPTDRTTILNTFNKPLIQTQEFHSVIERFDESLKIYENSLAIVNQDETISFSELYRKSLIAAGILQEDGAHKGDVIAIKAETTILSIIWMFGILRCGCVYVPVNASNPPERTISILKQCNAKFFINTDSGATTNNEWLNISPELINQKTNDTCIPETILANDLAYILFTSGSTGQPKGVMVEHHSLSNLMDGVKKTIYDVPENENELLLVSLSFDVSIKQIFGSLLNGKTLHLASAALLKNPYELSNYIVDNEIHILDASPGLFSVLLTAGFHKQENVKLRKLILGSEALPVRLLKEFYQHSTLKDIDLYNFYGPTETCVEASHYKVDPKRLPIDEICPIGSPTHNVQLYIVDSFNHILPIGVPGEICIVGEGVARGYINDEALRSNRFITDPVEGKYPAYLSGDIGWYDDDGNIHFMGRIDEQVKIRGYRIELQEIEKVLSNHPDIENAVLKVLSDGAEKILAAYVQLENSINENEIRNWLISYLPEYMIPTFIIGLDAFPMKASGKIDKAALPDPRRIKKSESVFESVEKEKEREVWNLWVGILKNENIGRNDNFFQIGGNSLLLIELHKELGKKFGNVFEITDLFSYTTIKEQAEQVEKSASSKVHLSGISAPEEVFNEQVSEDTLFEASLSQASLQKLRNSDNVALAEAIFSGLLLYVLSEKLELDSVSICYVSDTGNVLPIEINFEEIEDLHSLFRLIADQLQNNNSLDITILKKNQNNLYIGIIDVLISNKRDDIGFFDILVGYDTDSEKIELKVNGNIQSEFGSEILELFISAIESME